MLFWQVRKAACVLHHSGGPSSAEACKPDFKWLHSYWNNPLTVADVLAANAEMSELKIQKIGANAELVTIMHHKVLENQQKRAFLPNGVPSPANGRERSPTSGPVLGLAEAPQSTAHLNTLLSVL